MKRPLALYLLCALHIFLGLGGVTGGTLMILSPDGALLGMDPSWLAKSPFDTYIIPGIVLFLFVGLFPMFACAGLLFKLKLPPANTLNLYPTRHWAWAWSLYSGIMVIVWIVVQQVMTQYFWLQPMMVLTGLLIIVFTLIPAVMKYSESHER